jgi:hypothetical protein
VHQLGPEWFTVDALGINVILEANSRLTIAPGTEAIIGSDLLRVNLASTSASQINYTIVKAAKYGQLRVRNAIVDHFTQLDINQRQLSYRHEHPIDAWIKRDSFQFIVAINNNDSIIMDERRFRILITFAAIGVDQLDKWVPTRVVRVSALGSCAINSSHINLDRLSNASGGEQLVMHVQRVPRHGLLEIADRNWTRVDSLTVTMRQLAANSLVYRHSGANVTYDDMVVQVLPANELSRRRLLAIQRTITIEIVSTEDSSLLVCVTLGKNPKLSTIHLYNIIEPLFRSNRCQLN